MGNKLLYGFLFIWVKLHALLPLSILYILSDILYLVIYKLAHYRRNVVRENMRSSFPEKPEAELLQLEKEFYHHFCDYIVETIKLAHISYEEIIERARLNNPELLHQLHREGHTCMVLMMGHYGNWEWYTHSDRFLHPLNLYQIYRPLSNPAFDKLMIYLRTRFGAKGIKKGDTVREMIRLAKSGEPSIIIFLADQTPNTANLNYWTTLFNQPTPMLTGGEKIARKQNLPVVFLDLKKVKRGYYAIDMILITDRPNELPEFQITEEYTRLLERMILRQPAYWLWTHKRWKYKHMAPCNP